MRHFELLSVLLTSARLVSTQQASCYWTSTILLGNMTSGLLPTPPITNPVISSTTTRRAPSLSNALGFGSITTYAASGAEQSLASAQESELAGVPTGQPTSAAHVSSTSSTPVPVLSTNPVYITVTTPGKQRKRAIYYVAFDGNKGVLVASQDAAGVFVLQNGYLMSGGQYLGTNSIYGYAAFQLYPSPPANSQGWAYDGTQIVFRDATFCEANDQSLYIILDPISNPPFACTQITPDAILVSVTILSLSSVIKSSAQDPSSIFNPVVKSSTIATTSVLVVNSYTNVIPVSPTPLASPPASNTPIATSNPATSIKSTTTPFPLLSLSVIPVQSSPTPSVLSSSAPHIVSVSTTPVLSSPTLPISQTTIYMSSLPSSLSSSTSIQLPSISLAANQVSSTLSSITSRGISSSSSNQNNETAPSSTSSGQATSSYPPASSSSTQLPSSTSLSASSASSKATSASTSVQPSISVYTSAFFSQISSTTASSRRIIPTSPAAFPSSTNSSETGSSPSSASSASSAVPTSKRGLAYTNVTLTQFYAQPNQNSQVNWAYDYYSLPNASNNMGPTNQNLVFVPLLYNDASSLTSIWAANVNYSIAHYKTDALLAFNEPDECGGGKSACMTIAASVAGYKKFIQPFADQVLLGAPAVTNAGPPASLTYLSYFLGNCTGCTIDFIPIHWYASPYSFSYLMQYVQQAYQVGGQRPIWITELGMDSQNYADAAVQKFMKNATTWLDAQPYVHRYSWFGDFTGYLVNTAGNGLSAQGLIFNNYTGGYIYP